ncbi:T9SS type A sorting domain-containing protein [uncultured Psychroserpens sp.]|uniref:T9SS type A sorting domain-containing protein n=1 Tax=uncultured Psychroserpens sp. TaxID=255436 RepID=UPI002631AB57|nr:T9SS type A sorting domain-containing protein [uncultured Psychroserpens sp.]
MKKITLLLMFALVSGFCFAQPANDDPSGATALTVGVVFADNAVVATNVASTDSEVADPSIPTTTCGAYAGEDVWFTVTVPATGNVSLGTDANAGSTMTDTVLEVYSGAIGAFVSEGCNDDGGPGAFSLVQLTGRTPGEVLYVRVWEYNGGITDTFQASAYDTPPPSNDDCANAIAVNCDDVVTGDTSVSGVTDTVGNPSNDLWYSYAGPAGDITVSLCNSSYDTFIRVFDACGGSEIASNDDSCGTRSSTTFTADGTSTYYIAVEGFNANNGAFELLVECAGTIPPPANDECANAIGLTLLTPESGTTAGATEDLSHEKPGCDPFGTIADVWYSFTMPVGTNTLNVTTTVSGTSSEANLAIYPNDCNILDANILACDDTGGVAGETLTIAAPAGTTYLIRVWSDGVAPRLSGEAPTEARIEGTFDVVADATLSTEEFENENAFTYFPNPVKGELTLNAQKDIQNVAVFNMLGQEVLRTAPNAVESTINMNALSQGAYFVQVTIGDVTETVRIIKQ